MFFLRCTPTFTFDDLLSRFDSITREGLSRILGHPLTDLQWRQAKLPISMSGVGLQGAEDMAAVAFATSYISSHSLIKDLLYTNDEDIEASLPVGGFISKSTGKKCEDKKASRRNEEAKN